MTAHDPAGPLRVLADPTSSLSALVGALADAERALPDARRARMGIASNVTLDLLEVYLRRHAFLGGVNLGVEAGGYDDMVGDVERYSAAGVETALLLTFFDNLLPSFEAQLGHLPDEVVAAKLEEYRARVRVALARGRGIRTVIAATFHRLSRPTEPGAGDRVDAVVAAFNSALASEVAEAPNAALLDLAPLVADLGRDNAFDRRFYYRGKAPYAGGLLDALARRVTAVTRCFDTYYYKVLALDCDDTLWGGIVGEDSLDGIRLGPFDYPGNVFWTVQHEIAALGRRGVLLCLCTKNNPADVDEVLTRHPHMVLKDRDFVVKKVDWQDKASNLRAIAAELNLGLDSFVFLDDSAFECAAVRDRLPMVRTFRVPSTLSEYPRVMGQIKDLFLAGGVSEESAEKGEQYRRRRAAESERARFVSHEDYLASLGLRVAIRRDARESAARISELTRKSNQFNLTTRRYTEADILGMMESDAASVYSFTVGDTFGDAGLTGVLILTFDGPVATVDSFLMSCRVIGRGVEFSIWAPVAADAAARGCTLVRAEYVPTAKNAQVADFFDRLGMARSDTAGGGRTYEAALAAMALPEHPWIEVVYGR